MYLQISLIIKDNTGEILNKIVIELLPAKNANSSVFIVSVKFPNDEFKSGNFEFVQVCNMLKMNTGEYQGHHYRLIFYRM
jgi:hypothetical protein